ncbi:hypothetical protein AAA799E16_00675 [Marine Group I thaumarchaeote SCGC AAA799-E16]|uniref:Uncharacterized protein n=4 Tax=Marine Group I TaxID=905826 RepID=A0A087S5Y3_9ARCH|nr:hypothetical protein AAA799E16_00675 [Marine Group I thaumarchaeote SCGC AAA799-E16]KFM16071.1 hypothetical protein AAA799D11_00870 [Marine Group I thaumarchaeote SCGC AAA799-D11]KFM17808.1 hypothetical protein SCCGRSA3_01748 [Marine Group I thaumarchaeote SCGC RSA3]KFM21137.1 hypothetical protein AAA799B03_01338 [Marine Group I thaumarchaeote SCGC AAA799-B03]
MNKLIIIPIILGIAAIVSYSMLIPEESSEPLTTPIYNSGFTYYDIETIQTSLKEYDIFVSSPTAITDHTISQYCTFFEKGLPRNVEYCTTTAVLDSDGNTIGNINIGGSTASPILAIANLETDTLESDKETTYAIFTTVIQTLVCDCWEEEESIGFETIPDWLDTVHTFYYDSDERNIKSKIDNLADTEILFEITSKDNSVLQTLIITKHV